MKTTVGAIVLKNLHLLRKISQRKLATKIYKKYPQLFLNEEAVRTRIRYYVGSLGKLNRTFRPKLDKDNLPTK